MADLSIKQQIIARILSNLEALATDSATGFRKVFRATQPVLLNPITPSLQIIINPQHLVEEDTAGYVFEFPLDLWITVADPRDPYGVADALAPFVEEALENDLQLNSLANVIRPDGDQPFTNELTAGTGGSVLLYTVQYRRKRAQSTVHY